MVMIKAEAPPNSNKHFVASESSLNQDWISWIVVTNRVYPKIGFRVGYLAQCAYT